MYGGAHTPSGSETWIVLTHADGGELRVPAFSIRYMLQVDDGTTIGLGHCGGSDQPLEFRVQQIPAEIMGRLEVVRAACMKRYDEEIRRSSGQDFDLNAALSDAQKELDPPQH